MIKTITKGNKILQEETDYEALRKFDKGDVKAAIKSAKEFVKKVEEIISYE